MLTHIYLNNTYFLPTHIQVKWKILSFVISSSCFIVLHLNFQIETENVIFAIIETVHKTVILFPYYDITSIISRSMMIPMKNINLQNEKLLLKLNFRSSKLWSKHVSFPGFRWFILFHRVQSHGQFSITLFFCYWYFGEIMKIYRYLQDQQKYSINDRVLKIRRVDKPHALIV